MMNHIPKKVGPCALGDLFLYLGIALLVTMSVPLAWNSNRAGSSLQSGLAVDHVRVRSLFGSDRNELTSEKDLRYLARSATASGTFKLEINVSIWDNLMFRWVREAIVGASGGDGVEDGKDAGGNTKRNPSFAVYRMLGNDMWPLHGVGQTRRNSVFAALNEKQPPSDVRVLDHQPNRKRHRAFVTHR